MAGHGCCERLFLVTAMCSVQDQGHQGQGGPGLSTHTSGNKLQVEELTPTHGTEYDSNLCPGLT